MNRGISEVTKRELVQAVAGPGRLANQSEKGQIMDEIVKLKKYHRKYTI